MLRRDLGLLDAVGVGFGAIVGAGIFVVTGIAAGVAGPALLLGLALAGVAATCNALSSAQLAAQYPLSGGTYEYGNRVLNPWLGFSAGWLFLTSKIAAAGTVAIGLSAYLAVVLPGVPPRAVAVGAILLFTALNYFGIRRSSRLNLLIVAVSLGSLIIFAVAGAGRVEPANFRPFIPHGIGSVLESAALLFFAFTGYARIATLAEEVREPERTIPRAIIITIAGAVIVYAAVAVVAIGSGGIGALSGSPAPLQSAALISGPSWLPALISTGGVTAMLGVILSQLLGLSRMGYAMARGGDLPKFLDAVDHRTGVPGRAVLLIGGIAAIVAGTGTLRGVAAAASFAILIYYLIANIAALRMPARAKLFHDAVPAVGVIACAVLAVSLDPQAIGAGVGLLAVGLTWRSVLVRRRVRTQ